MVFDCCLGFFLAMGGLYVEDDFFHLLPPLLQPRRGVILVI